MYRTDPYVIIFYFEVLYVPIKTCVGEEELDSNKYSCTIIMTIHVDP